MPTRTDEANAQIKTARAMPSSSDDGDTRRPDTQQCKDAEAPAESHPGAPSKLPGYGR